MQLKKTIKKKKTFSLKKVRKIYSGSTIKEQVVLALFLLLGCNFLLYEQVKISTQMKPNCPLQKNPLHFSFSIIDIWVVKNFKVGNHRLQVTKRTSHTEGIWHKCVLQIHDISHCGEGRICFSASVVLRWQKGFPHTLQMVVLC